MGLTLEGLSSCLGFPGEGTCWEWPCRDPAEAGAQSGPGLLTESRPCGLSARPLGRGLPHPHLGLLHFSYPDGIAYAPAYVPARDSVDTVGFLLVPFRHQIVL